MFPRVLPLSLVMLGLALAAGPRGQAQLASKSPFVPPQAGGNTPAANAPLQFIGYMDTSEGRLFRIHDPAKKTSAWLKLNERNADFDVIAKQHGDKSLTIEHQGRTLTLAEREPKIVSSGNAAQMMPPPVPVAVASNVPPAVTQAVVLNPTPADEQKRLEAVAAEVARRRALREQASQQLAPGQAPPPAVQGQPAPAQPVPQGAPPRGGAGPATMTRQR